MDGDSAREPGVDAPRAADDAPRRVPALRRRRDPAGRRRRRWGRRRYAHVLVRVFCVFGYCHCGHSWAWVVVPAAPACFGESGGVSGSICDVFRAPSGPAHAARALVRPAPRGRRRGAEEQDPGTVPGLIGHARPRVPARPRALPAPLRVLLRGRPPGRGPVSRGLAFRRLHSALVLALFVSISTLTCVAFAFAFPLLLLLPLPLPILVLVPVPVSVTDTIAMPVPVVHNDRLPAPVAPAAAQRVLGVARGGARGRADVPTDRSDAGVAVAVAVAVAAA
ncbi:hypothetical protein C8Q79DRAFT_930984, partial [Trametes meyenii]